DTCYAAGWFCRIVSRLFRVREYLAAFSRYEASAQGSWENGAIPGHPDRWSDQPAPRHALHAPTTECGSQSCAFESDHLAASRSLGGVFLQTEVAISASALLVFASNTAIIGSYHVFLALSRMEFFPQFILKRNAL